MICIFGKWYNKSLSDTIYLCNIVINSICNVLSIQFILCSTPINQSKSIFHTTLYHQKSTYHSWSFLSNSWFLFNIQAVRLLQYIGTYRWDWKVSPQPIKYEITWGPNNSISWFKMWKQQYNNNQFLSFKSAIWAELAEWYISAFARSADILKLFCCFLVW